MNIRHNEALREQLASEYVLGTLRGGARRRFESWLKDDAALRRTVSEWQDRIYPLAEMTAEVKPSKQVWKNIEKSIEASVSPQDGAQTNWWRRLEFWRGVSLASVAVSLLLTAFIALRHPDAPVMQTNYVAVLTDKDARTRIVVTGDTARHQLRVKMFTPPSVTSKEDLELWALPDQGRPRSLGLLAGNGEIVLALPADVSMETVPMLAVSLENKGGSSNPNGPTGPVLLKGDLLRL